MCHIACWFRSGAVLKFDQFYNSCFYSKQSLDLFPLKCTYAKVIDLRNTVLCSIGGSLQIDIAYPPHQISLCPLLESAAKSNVGSKMLFILQGLRELTLPLLSDAEITCTGVHNKI